MSSMGPAPVVAAAEAPLAGGTSVRAPVALMEYAEMDPLSVLVA